MDGLREAVLGDAQWNEELLKQKQNDLKTKIADLEAVVEKYERMWNNG